MRYLRVVPEGVDLPSSRHLHAQLLAKIAFAVEQLTHERFAAWHVHFGHHVHATHDSQPTFLDKLAEGGFFLRVPLQERLHVADLVKNETVVGMGLQ
jgi:hypothetical protein